MPTPAAHADLDRGLLALQAALFGRAVYGPGHAAVRAKRDEALAALGAALAQRGGVMSVVAVEQRVVADGRPLPSSAALSRGLFDALRRRGADGLTLSPGLAADDLDALLAALRPGSDAHADADDRPGLPARACLRPAVIFAEHPDALRAATPTGQTATITRDADHAAALTDVWRSVGGGGLAAQRGALSSLVGELTAAVAGASASMLPLAQLKRFDEYTFIHTVNVALLAGALAQAVGLPADASHDLTVAAVLHDVGKRAVPGDMLHKPGALSPAELALIQRHPVDGARMLLSEPGLPEVAAIVAFEHHQHLDGTGYPRPHGDTRPHLASQIVQLADVYDALRTHRPYRAALSAERAAEMITEHAGTRYDAALVQAFLHRVAPRAAA